MNKARLTIIVPCYNREKTIVRCLDSIITQMTEKDRLIVVDDKSTDKSLEILKEKYGNKNNITILENKINLGVSAARNRAIDIVDTELLTFVDSDDTISEGYIEYIKNKFNDANIQMLATGLTYVDEKTGLKNKVLPNLTQGNMKEKVLSLDIQGLIASTCNKVYLASIIKENKICFNESVKMMEDFEFNFNYIRYIKDIFVEQQSWYNYIHHGVDSASSKFQPELYSRYLEIKKLREEFYLLDGNEIEKEVFNLNTEFLLICVNNLYKHGSNLTKKQRRKELKKILTGPDFIKWKKEGNKSGIFRKIIYLCTITNAKFSDVCLKLVHKLKGNSKLITKIFRVMNKK